VLAQRPSRQLEANTEELDGRDAIGALHLGRRIADGIREVRLERILRLEPGISLAVRVELIGAGPVPTHVVDHLFGCGGLHALDLPLPHWFHCSRKS
jgi:hypothetical protein